jgi:hypothetical protein
MYFFFSSTEYKPATGWEWRRIRKALIFNVRDGRLRGRLTAWLIVCLTALLFYCLSEWMNDSEQSLSRLYSCAAQKFVTDLVKTFRSLPDHTIHTIY